MELLVSEVVHSINVHQLHLLLFQIVLLLSERAHSIIVDLYYCHLPISQTRSGRWEIEIRVLTYPAHPAGYPSGMGCCPDGYKIITATNSDNTSYNKEYPHTE